MEYRWNLRVSVGKKEEMGVSGHEGLSLGTMDKKVCQEAPACFSVYKRRINEHIDACPPQAS